MRENSYRNSTSFQKVREIEIPQVSKSAVNSNGNPTNVKKCGKLQTKIPQYFLTRFTHLKYLNFENVAKIKNDKIYFSTIRNQMNNNFRTKITILNAII